MKKRDIVKSSIIFDNIINTGIKTANKYFVILKKRKEEINNQFGIAVGKKVGNAVTRNKVKRQMRNIIDNNRKAFSSYHNYIIICKKEILNLSYLEMEKNFLNLLNKGENNEK